MRLPRNRWLLSLGLLAIVGIPGFWFLAPATAHGDDALVTRVKRGEFKVLVTTAGELRARKFVQIQGPPNAQQAEVYQMKISSIVAEGTLVKEGEVVAELDRSAVATKLAEVTLALQKAQALYTQAQLDSTLNLSQSREDIRNMESSLEEKRIAKEQAQYEAPSIKRQAEIDLERAQRALAQSKTNYVTKTNQAIAKMSEVGAELERQRNKVNAVQTVMQGFTIKAPSPGMVIYVKEWNGRKKVAGSQVSPWDPTVATLPDLTQMESVTYVNEIDVRKLAVGQPVTVGLDADPSKKLPGVVTGVANVGEQRPNADAKVFEVKISVERSDTTLRPGMTSSNGIETRKLANVLFAPLEAVMGEGNIPFVYKRSGGSVVKQEVETGAMSDNEVVIARGVREGDELLLSPPADARDLQMSRITPSTKKVPVGDTPATRTVPVTGTAAPDTARAAKGLPSKTPPFAAPRSPAR
jgi:multidrug efflux pump subunit AcrA (membrane-fusion protein)